MQLIVNDDIKFKNHNSYDPRTVYIRNLTTRVQDN